MGGSFALALKRAGLVKRVVGCSKSPSTTEQPRQMGVIDVAAESALLAVSGSDIVLLAVPVAPPTTFKAIRHLVEPGMLFMDVGSTKRDVVARAPRAARTGGPFVPAHPIAGKERASARRRGALPAARSSHALPQTAPDLVQRPPTSGRRPGRPGAADDAGEPRRRLRRRQPPAAPAGLCAIQRRRPNQPGKEFPVARRAGLSATSRASPPATRRCGATSWPTNREECSKASPTLPPCAGLARTGHLSGNVDALEGPDPPCAPTRNWHMGDHARAPGLPDDVPMFATSTCRRCRWPAPSLPGSKASPTACCCCWPPVPRHHRHHDLLDRRHPRHAGRLAPVGLHLFPRRCHVRHPGLGGAARRRGRPVPRQRRHRHAPAHRRAGGARRHDFQLWRAAHARTPIGDLVDALRRLRLPDVDTWAPEGYPPLRCHPAGGRSPLTRRSGARRRVEPVPHRVADGAAAGGESGSRDHRGDRRADLRPHIEITLNLLARFGVRCSAKAGRRFTIPRPAPTASPGACTSRATRRRRLLHRAGRHRRHGQGIRIEGVGANSIRATSASSTPRGHGRPSKSGPGWLQVHAGAGRFRAIDLDANHIPDAAMTLAVMALYADGPTRLRNIASWRGQGPTASPPWRPNCASSARPWSRRRRLHRGLAAGAPEACRARSTPTTTTAWRCASLAAFNPAGPCRCASRSGAWPRPSPTTSGAVLGRVPRRRRAGDHGRRPTASGKGTLAAGGAALGFPPARLRRALPHPPVPGGTAPAPRRGRPRRPPTRWLACRSFRRRPDPGWRRRLNDVIRSCGGGRRGALASPGVAALAGRARRRCMRCSSVPPPAGLVADGRDMGTVVFPGRAQGVPHRRGAPPSDAERRYKQLISAKGSRLTSRPSRADLEARDARTRRRPSRPNRQDAPTLDNSILSIEQSWVDTRTPGGKASARSLNLTQLAERCRVGPTLGSRGTHAANPDPTIPPPRLAPEPQDHNPTKPHHRILVAAWNLCRPVRGESLKNRNARRRGHHRRGRSASTSTTSWSTPDLKSEGYIPIEVQERPRRTRPSKVGDFVRWPSTPSKRLRRHHPVARQGQAPGRLDGLEKALESANSSPAPPPARSRAASPCWSTASAPSCPARWSTPSRSGHLTPFENKTMEFKVIKLDRKRNNVVLSAAPWSKPRWAKSARSCWRTSGRRHRQGRGQEHHRLRRVRRPGRHRRPAAHHRHGLAPRAPPERSGQVGDEGHRQGPQVRHREEPRLLGLKQLGDDPWMGVARRYPQAPACSARSPTSPTTARSSRSSPGIEGLVHVSEMDWTNKNVPRPRSSLGDEVEVMVLEIDEDKRRISWA